MRWTNKGLGLISTPMLARILRPRDYGVVAMAMLVVGLAEVLIDFGVNTALLREPNASRDFSDSAWTLGVIQGVVLGVVLYASWIAGSRALAGRPDGIEHLVFERLGLRSPAQH